MRTNMKQRHGTSPKRWALLIVQTSAIWISCEPGVHRSPGGCTPGYFISPLWGEENEGATIPVGCTPGYFVSPLRGEENEDATIPGGCTPGYFISPLRGEENEDDRTKTIKTSLRANPSGPNSLIDHMVMMKTFDAEPPAVIT